MPTTQGPAHAFLEQEARALLVRIGRMRPFALYESMVPAAAPSVEAQAGMEGIVAAGREELRRRVTGFIAWIGDEGRSAPPAHAQRLFTILRMRYNVVLSQFDLFADAVTQRSEAQTGVWLAGLDTAAADALAMPGYLEAPPLLCYLDRGPGAAIRRARTRIPGGVPNPVAIIRVPRERMIGSGISSSLFHEVGHQGAALLGLVDSLRAELRQAQAATGDARWSIWDRWISEIVADFWSVARLGITATVGLMAVVSLPRAFVMRVNGDDPHPTPWLRVRLSCAMGNALYPDAQWDAFARMWESLYPRPDDAAQQQWFASIEQSMPAFVGLLVAHRPAALRGASLGGALASAELLPQELRRRSAEWDARPERVRAARPSLAFAVLGQARVEGRITPEAEASAVAGLLTYWALRSATDGYWAVHGAPARGSHGLQAASPSRIASSLTPAGRA